MMEMASIMYKGLFVLLLLTSRGYSAEAVETGDPSETESNRAFVVYLGHLSTTSANAHRHIHMDMLTRVLGSAQAAEESMLYSYTKSFNGFAAVFSESHAQSFRDMDGVASVFPSKMHQTHSTAAFEYLGLSPSQGLWQQSDFGRDVIVGVLDTGVWPESESFRDDGLGPIPSKWKGTCEAGDQFSPENCNRKLIGARFYSKGYEAARGPVPQPEYRSPRDWNGHGTHAASTAAGMPVQDASFFGLANGTASGGAPAARVAVYKVCWKPGGGNDTCADVDVLAAYEDAIADGVDIISVSLGGAEEDYLSAVAIGSFHAVDNGILVSASAGNGAQRPNTVQNVAPWIMTVGANTLNRRFIATLHLGDGKSYQGQGANTYEMNSSYPLVYGGDIPASPNVTSESCGSRTLDGAMATGKIIVCNYDPSARGIDQVVLALGAVGVILISDPSLQSTPDYDPTSFLSVLPYTVVNGDEGRSILEYVHNTRSPQALIEKSSTTFDLNAPPVMARFSRTSPNFITPNILKPDLTAPGVNILAAYPPVSNPSSGFGDRRSASFNILSGTSMSCPVVSGSAALLKSVHPDWSPASIKSALMTTATPLDASIKENTGLATGSGQINPTKAVDPGLVYNASMADYLTFLCASEYRPIDIALFTGQFEPCTPSASTVLDLNYPSILLTLNASESSPITETTRRTLTNVGQAAEYNVTVVAPTGVTVTVAPSSLSFAELNDQRSFTVSIEVEEPSKFLAYAFGEIVWSDGTHLVRMPIGVVSSLY